MNRSMIIPDNHPLPEWNWLEIEGSLDLQGNAVLPGLISPSRCEQLAAMYSEEDHYRARIVMAKHGFGRGEYKYFAYPLPALLSDLRQSLYSQLAPIANRWNREMGVDVRYPPSLEAFLKRCHDAGQLRPTPLSLTYVKGDYNCLHQDLYGKHVFPLQVAILLSRPNEDFTGGEFVMTQDIGTSRRADVVLLKQGDAVVFTVNQRPLVGKRTAQKVAMRHGVSQIRSGERKTVGLIFHDAL